MSRPDIQVAEKVFQLDEKSAIWKVHVDLLREQDKNARVMSKDKFDRLVANIKKDKRLESLPLVAEFENPSGNREFQIISGHHRVRAARVAGLGVVYVIALEEKLSKDKIRSKQLAHNALAGYDDPQMLKELFLEIEDVESRIESGIKDSELMGGVDPVPIDDITLALDYQAVFLLFLDAEKTKFDDVLGIVEADSAVHGADLKCFPEFKKAARMVAHGDDIRNLTAIVSRMCDIVLEFYKERARQAAEVKEHSVIGV